MTNAVSTPNIPTVVMYIAPLEKKMHSESKIIPLPETEQPDPNMTLDNRKVTVSEAKPDTQISIPNVGNIVVNRTDFKMLVGEFLGRIVKYVKASYENRRGTVLTSIGVPFGVMGLAAGILGAVWLSQYPEENKDQPGYRADLYLAGLILCIVGWTCCCCGGGVSIARTKYNDT